MEQPAQEEFSYHFKKPGGVSPEFIDEIVRLVEGGDLSISNG